jgi:hypothetical protein
MTATHYTARYLDPHGRVYYAGVGWDKHSPGALCAEVWEDLAVYQSFHKNTPQGEAYLIKRLNAWRYRHGLKLISEDYTKYSHKQKGQQA